MESKETIERLKEIRTKLLLGVENKELLYIKAQINNIDTLLFDMVIRDRLTSNDENNDHVLPLILNRWNRKDDDILSKMLD